MINGNEKGKRGELEWSKFCNEKGYSVRRTAQYCGKTGDASDCVGLPGIHIEVKRVENLNVYKAIEQALRDSEGSENIPIVAHRKNRKGWLVTMTADDFFKFFDKWSGTE